MIMSALLVVASPFNFAGGNDSALVSAVFRSLGENTAMMVTPGRTWKRAAFDYAKKGDLETAVKRRFEFAPTGDLMVGDASIPAEFFFKQSVARYAHKLPADSEVAKLAFERLWLRIGKPDVDVRTLAASAVSLRKEIYSHADLSQGIWAVVYSNGAPSCRVKG